MIEDGLRDPWSGKLMYEQASAVADELGLERADLDGWALRSHERAIAAIDAGRFAEEIVPVEVAGRRSATQVEVDEGPRRDTSLEALAALRPLTPEHPTHTAGNSPGVTDGAAALVVADEEWARARGTRPARPDPGSGGDREPARLARTHAGGGGAHRAGASRAGTRCSRPLRDQRGVRVGRAAVEPRARSRPRARERRRRRGRRSDIRSARSGARLLTTLVRQLEATGGGIGVAAICSGGGQGDAMVLEVLRRA